MVDTEEIVIDNSLAEQAWRWWFGDNHNERENNRENNNGNDHENNNENNHGI